MRYYKDIDGVYNYLEKSGRKVYDDQIVEPVKDPSYEASASGTGLLFGDVKTYLDKLVRNILKVNKAQTLQEPSKNRVILELNEWKQKTSYANAATQPVKECFKRNIRRKGRYGTDEISWRRRKNSLNGAHKSTRPHLDVRRVLLLAADQNEERTGTCWFGNGGYRVRDVLIEMTSFLNCEFFLAEISILSPCVAVPLEMNDEDDDEIVSFGKNANRIFIAGIAVLALQL
ncbi:uncharacterized protein LOC127136662 [Lathyrus oleraceus]|uniref:uncharacterized protein LOC127136662 n=1 Tax=Pisum sativum TaxID=3888 RepID=UPI0021D3808D|nr:uncharacterized protein LOC127136662 [Pisum sativum]